MKIIRSIIILIVFAVICIAGWEYFKYSEKLVVQEITKGVITQMQSVQNLETAKMTITKIMEGEKQIGDLIPWVSIDNMIQNFLFQDKIVLEIEGEVRAGFDLSKFNSSSITVHDDHSISIKLPAAQILWTSLNENTKPFTRDLWVLTKGNIQLETQVRNNAKNLIEQEALQAGILLNAEKNAQEYITKLLTSLHVTVKEVIIDKENTQPLP